MGIVIGAAQLARRKGGTSHRALGYPFAGGMVLADASALTILQFTGGFNILHAGTIMNLACIAAATRPLVRRPRPANWIAVHYCWISGAYVGLIAAAAAEFVVCVVPFATKGQVWAATGITAAVITTVGSLLIARYHPRSPDASDELPGTA